MTRENLPVDNLAMRGATKEEHNGLIETGKAQKLVALVEEVILKCSTATYGDEYLK